MTPSTHTPARNANIDMIRTVAIVAVVCVHMDVFGYTPRLSCLSDILLTAVMMMFVICSGHFIFPLRGSARDFLLRRMRALLPGYILAAMFYSWAQVFLAGDIIYSVEHRMEWMWLVSPVGFLWFVTMMIGLYLFVPFLSPWTAQASRRSVDVFLLLGKEAVEIFHLRHGIAAAERMPPSPFEVFRVHALQLIADVYLGMVRA